MKPSVISPSCALALTMTALILLTACNPQAPSTVGSAPRSDQPTEAAPPATAPMDKFRIATVPSADSQQQVQRFGPFRDYLARKLGVEVEQFVAADYGSVVEAMRANRIEAAWYGPFSYVLAAQEANARAVAAYIGTNGETTYKTWFIVPASSPIQTLSEVKARSKELTLALVDPASTSGNLYPRKKLNEMGLTPETDFKERVYAGGHDAALLAVANGRVDVGTVCDTCVEGFLAQGMASRDAFRIIGESDPIPNDPWAVRPDLDSGLVARFKDALLTVTESPEGVEALTAYVSVKGYQPIEDSTYNTVRDVAKVLNLDLKQLS